MPPIKSLEEVFPNTDEQGLLKQAVVVAILHPDENARENAITTLRTNYQDRKQILRGFAGPNQIFIRVKDENGAEFLVNVAPLPQQYSGKNSKPTYEF